MRQMRKERQIREKGKGVMGFLLGAFNIATGSGQSPASTDRFRRLNF